jgi:hypothetical protein
MPLPLKKYFKIAFKLLPVMALLLFIIGYISFWQLSQLNEKPLQIALTYFNAHQSTISNKKYLVVVDFTKPSFAKRLHIVDIQSGESTAYLVAHGSAKQNGSLFIPAVSNVLDSNASSAGFMLTAEEYIGKYGKSLKMDGLELSNSNVRIRDIVIHAATWVGYPIIIRNLATNLVPRIGESFGCLAVSTENIEEVIKRLGSGALIYVHVETL